MAVTFQSVTQKDYVTATTSNVRIDKPSGTVEGDLLFYHIGTTSTDAAITSPGGWTDLDALSYSGANYSIYYGFYVAGGSEGGDYNFLISSSSRVKGHILRFDGQALVDPILDTSAYHAVLDGQSGSNITCPSITTTVTASLLRIGQVQAMGNNTAPSGYTELSDFVGSGNALCAYLSDEVVGAGATGTAVITTGSGRRMSATIAIAEPAVVAAGGPTGLDYSYQWGW